MTDLQLYNKLVALPDDLKKEAEHYIDYLVEKTRTKKSKPEKKMPIPGLAKGLIKMSDDFDEPLEDFKDYM